MTAHERRRLANLSRPSLVLAVGSSAAVAAAAVSGHHPGTAEVVGGFAVAGAIAVLNGRSRPHARPHVLTPMSDEYAATVAIDAARARSMASHPAAGHSDAA